MKTYSVSDVATMLNVNEETVRRWIREEKLKAERNKGRGGSRMILEDVVAFANVPPRENLAALMLWLDSENIPFKLEKAEEVPKGKVKDSTAVGVAGGVASGVTTTVAAMSAPSALLGAAAIATPVAATAGVVAAAVTAAALKKRRKVPAYTIRLLNTEEAPLEKEEVLSPQETVPAPAEEAKTEEAPVVEAAPTLDVIAEIERAKKLLDLAIITAEEFKTIKEKLIARL